MALNGLFCADVPLRNYSLTHLSNLRKSFTVPETRVFQAADGENLEILAWTVFA